MKIQDKVACITGGASGLGAATAKRFVELGGKVALLDLNGELVKKIADGLGPNATSFPCNVSDAAAVEEIIQQVSDQFGAIHVNVNCAGVGAAVKTVGRDGPMPLDYFNSVIQINLVGTFNSLRLCAAVMQSNESDAETGEKGVIINTASVAAFEGQIGQVAYSASKGGVVGMTLPIARDLARDGIRCCTIAPGIFETPMMAAAPEKIRLPLLESVLFPKRLGEPEEYAFTVQHIVENTYLNGETIRLDAGIRMTPR